MKRSQFLVAAGIMILFAAFAWVLRRKNIISADEFEQLCEDNKIVSNKRVWASRDIQLKGDKLSISNCDFRMNSFAFKVETSHSDIGYNNFTKCDGIWFDDTGHNNFFHHNSILGTKQGYFKNRSFA